MLPRTIGEWGMLTFILALIAAVYFTSINPDYYSAIERLWP